MIDLFQEKAQDWDMDELVKGISSGIGSALEENLDFSSPMDAMDFGAGTGLVTGQLAAKVRTITAVDISAAMLEKLKAKEELRDRVEILCQDIIHNPISREFDLIVSAMAMHHVKDVEKLLRRFNEHLKPGGRIALADLDSEDGDFHPQGTEGVFHAGFDREEFAKLLKEQGFHDIRFVTAHTVYKAGKSYPIFLVLANKEE